MNILRRLEKRIVRGYQFINNVSYYYLDRGYRLKQAISLARDTL